MMTDQIMEYACDNLCRFPAEYKDPDDLWNEQCDHCKLIELLGEKNATIKSYEGTIRKLVDAITQPGDRKKGKWIDRDDIHYGWNAWECSACGEEFFLEEGTPDLNGYNYCPNCGADMRPEPPEEE